MMKKFLFLLTFLLLIGGGKMWATTDVIALNSFSSGEVSAKAFTRTGSLFSVSVTGCKLLNSNTFRLGDGTQFVITPSNSNVKVLSIGFTNIGTGSNTSATCSINGASVTGNVFIKEKGSSDSPKTCTWDNNTDATSFTIVFGKSVEDKDPYAQITSITVTYEVIYKGSLPFTWNFNSWPLTTSSMMTANENAKWTTSSSNYLYQLTPSGAALVDGNNDAISETSGLTFTATTAGDIWTDLNTGVGLKNNASVTIPAKTGQKIAVHAWWPAEEMSLTNAEYTSGVNTFTPSSGDGTYEFTATADNVTLQANTNNLYIYSIAVTKNDLTTFVVSNDENYYYGGTSGATFFNPNTTFTYNPTYTGGHYIRTRVNMNINTTSLTAADFEITSSDETVLDPSGFGKADARETGTSGIYKFIFNGIEAKKPGTAILTIKYKGSDLYNEKTSQETFTFAKATPSIAFAEAGNQTKNYSTSTYTNVASESTTYGRTITYSSSDTDVATVADGGVVTFVNSGKTVITATAEGDNYYNTASASYTLTVNGDQTPTITMQKGGTTVSKGATVETTYDNSIIVTGVSSANLPVKYRSEDTSIATVDGGGKITTQNGGTVKIYVYTEGSKDINPVETYYNLVINPSSFSMTFVPNSGTINIGKTITPYVTLPSVYAEDVTEITASSNNTGIATVVTKIWDKNNPSYDYLVVKEENGKHKIERIKPTITGIAKGTTTISLTLSSSQYITSTPAIYTITVADDSNLHFDWANKSTLTMYEGDYMMMPAITGNANGYPFEQNNAQRYVWAMTQDNDHVTSLNWYNTNYHPGEGEPFYWLTDNGGGDEYNKLAYILYAESSEARTGTHPEGLMIYARKAGTVEIHAKDMQLDQELSSTITLNILPKANIYGNKDNGDESDGLLTVEQKSITYPYTWDFTKDFSTTDLDANSYYWTKSGSTYSNGLALQNSDYGDDNHDGNNAGSQRLYKAILANGNTIPAFKGMTVQLQGTSFDSKYGRITLKPNADEGESHLHVTGGPQYFQLPAPATSGTDPEAYRVYVKAKPTQPNRGEIRLIAGGNNDYWFVNEKGQFHDDGIYWAPVVRGQDIKVAFQDVDVYWIAVSTEAKNFAKFENTSYYATTYSYPKDLDMDKSLNDVNTTVQPYYASAFNSADAVTMTAVSKSSHLAANTGVLLKSDENPGSCYMIAKPQNSTSVPEATSYATNYLKPNAEAGKVYGRDEENNKTRFVLAYRYIWVKADGTTDGTYTSCSDWSFVRAASTGATMSKNTAYLEVPGDIYVMMDVSNAARRAPEATSEDDTSEEDDGRPASKQLLRIVFEDEQPQTTEDPEPEEPETEEPEDGDSGIVKDRPRKPGDDGWPKPPFPPFPPIITDIDSVNTETTDNAVWHSMEGVRISQPTKPGLYIRNGKKVVIK